MASKLIIFAVLASVALNIFDSSAAASGELPAESFDVLDEINDHMNVIISQGFSTIKDFANLYRNKTEEIISGQETGSFGSIDLDFTAVAERAKIEAAYYLSATSIAAGTSCATGESFKDAFSANAEVIIVPFKSAVELVAAGEYPANKEQLDKLETEVREELIRSNLYVVDLISSCLNPDNRDDLNEVIQTVANGITTSFGSQVAHMFEIIRIYGNLVSDKNSYDMDSALTSIDSNRVKACTAFASAMEFIFGAIEAFFLDRTLGGTDIVEILYVSQYSAKITLNNLNNTYDPAFTAMVNTLEKRTNVVEIGRLNYFPSTLANQTVSDDELQIATIAALDAIKQTQPRTTLQVEAVKLIYPLVSGLITKLWFAFIGRAEYDGLLCTLIPTEIEAVKASQVPLVYAFVELLYITIGYKGISNVTAQADTIDHAVTANDLIYTGIQEVSKIICPKRPATQADFDGIRRQMEQTDINMIEFTKTVYNTNLKQVVVNHGYTIAGDGESSPSQASSSLGDTFSTALEKLRSLLNQNPLQRLIQRIG